MKLIWYQDRHLLLQWDAKADSGVCTVRAGVCSGSHPGLCCSFTRAGFQNSHWSFSIHAVFPTKDAGHVIRFPGKLELFWVQVFFFSGLGVPLWFHCLHSHWLGYVAHLLMYFMTVLCKFCFFPLQKVQHQLEGIIKKTWFILKSMNPEENRITKYPQARHQKLQAAEIPDILLKYTEPLTYSRLQIPLT